MHEGTELPVCRGQPGYLMQHCRVSKMKSKVLSILLAIIEGEGLSSSRESASFLFWADYQIVL
jgi:hypothetical protein